MSGEAFEWVEGARYGALDPAKVGKAVTRLRHRTPEAVLEAARSDKSPLHDAFVWDDTDAAHLFRLSQAAQILRELRVVVIAGEVTKVRAFPRVVTERGAEYVAAKDARDDPALRAQVIDDYKRRIFALNRELRHFEEFAPVVAAIDELKAAA